MKKRDWLLGVGILTWAAASAPAGGIDPWADSLINVVPGADPNPAYPDATTALGAPERFTGEGSDYPGVVSIFNPPWGGGEIVSLGAGGSLTVGFDEPVTNDSAHAFGVDLIIFSNAFFIDDAWPSGIVGGSFHTGTMRVLVSQNGVNYFDVGTYDPSLYPTQGYRDVSAYSTTPGADSTDFLRPVNPALTFASFLGQDLSGVLSLYDGSGGGVPIDISVSGLSSVSFVRVETAGGVIQVDAFAAVPEPATALLFGLFACSALWRRG